MGVQDKKTVMLELPHGGHCIPPEVVAYLDTHLTIDQLWEDSDEYSDMLFRDLKVPHYVLRGDYWRALIDYNRFLFDRSSDGVVKTHTSQGVQIYQSETGLPDYIADVLIEKYVTPYHEKFTSLLSKEEITHVVFCHTMPGLGTPNSLAEDAGEYRPIFSLMNGGDESGDHPDHEYYASGELLRLIAVIVRDYASELDTDFKFNEFLTFNKPYNHFVSPKRFEASIFQNKHPFCIEVNRDLIKKNPANVLVVRNMLCEIVQFLTMRTQ